ncbi:uncharacterized [Tachysurus ichikawai]
MCSALFLAERRPVIIGGNTAPSVLRGVKEADEKQRHLFDVCQEKRNHCPKWLLTRFRFSWHARMTGG